MFSENLSFAFLRCISGQPLLKCEKETFNPTYMLENMALMFLPSTVNAGLCGKATFGFKGCGLYAKTYNIFFFN